MFVGGLRMIVRQFAVLVSSRGVILRFFVLSKIVMMGRLMMMVGSSVMMSGGRVVMLTGRMLGRLRHAEFLPNR
jgi:hypothetical protein